MSRCCDWLYLTFVYCAMVGYTWPWPLCAVLWLVILNLCVLCYEWLYLTLTFGWNCNTSAKLNLTAQLKMWSIQSAHNDVEKRIWTAVTWLKSANQSLPHNKPMSVEHEYMVILDYHPPLLLPHVLHNQYIYIYYLVVFYCQHASCEHFFLLIDSCK